MGAVSPIGNDLPTIWDNLMKGYCGIDFIKSFDTTDLPVKIAAELKDFDPEALGVDKGFVKRNDRFAIYAMASHEGQRKPTNGSWSFGRVCWLRHRRIRYHPA